MIQYDYGHENLRGFLAVLEDRLQIANNAAKQKDVQNCMQKWGKQNLSFMINHLGQQCKKDHHKGHIVKSFDHAISSDVPSLCN